MKSKKLSIHTLVVDLVYNQKLGFIIVLFVYLFVIFTILQGTRVSLKSHTESWLTFFSSQLEKYSEVSIDLKRNHPEIQDILIVNNNGEVIASNNLNFERIDIRSSEVYKKAILVNKNKEAVFIDRGLLEEKLLVYYVKRSRNDLYIITFFPDNFFPVTSSYTFFLAIDSNNNILYSTNNSLTGEKFTPYFISLIKGKFYYSNKIKYNKNLFENIYILQDGTIQVYILFFIGTVIFLLIYYLNRSLRDFKKKLTQLELESKEINELTKDLSIINSITEFGINGKLQEQKEILINFIYSSTAKEALFVENIGKLDRYRSLSESLLTLLTKIERIIINLNDAKSRYKHIYENIQEGVFQSTINGIVISANNSLAKTLGFESEDELISEISNNRYRLFKQVKDKEDFFNSIIENTSVKHFETVFKSKNGEDVYVVLSGIGVNDELKKLLYIQGSVRDLTIEQTARRLREEKERAEAISNTKSAFLANVSHELRTPLNAVIGFSELLAASIKDKRLKEYTNAILIAGKSLLTLITDILDLSKIEANKMEITKIPVSLKSVINDIIQIFSVTAHRKGIEISSHVANSIPSLLLLDEARIRQVLINLVGNSIKFTDEGYIKIKADIDSVENDTLVPNLILEVDDTGRGIKKEDLNKIFKEFEQVGSQKGIKGSGLGLAICRRLLELMNGSISVSSVLGEGSRFCILIKDVEIPQKNNSTSESRDFQPLSIMFDKASVLIIDDTEQVRDYIKEALSMLNLVVFAAEDGRSGLEMLDSVKPDLVLLDLKMPDISGVEVCKIIKQIPQLKNIPIIAFTASVDEGDLLKLTDKGFAGVLTKPIKLNDLTGMLSKFLYFTSILNPDDEVHEYEALSYVLSNECIKEIRSKWPNIESSDLIIKMKDVVTIISILKEHKYNKLVRLLSELKSRYDIEEIEKVLRQISKENKF